MRRLNLLAIARFAAVAIVLGVLFMLAKYAWSEYDYRQRTTGLFAELESSWEQVDVLPALARHQGDVRGEAWRQEALDTLVVIRTKVLSVLTQDEEWKRKQDWFDYWLETSRPEPVIRWAIAQTRWAAELITGLDSNINPFLAHRHGDHLRVFRTGDSIEPYRIYVPEELDLRKRHPVVIGFHSREGNESLFFHAFDGELLKRAAQKAGFIFVGAMQGGLLGRCIEPESKAAVQRLIAELTRQDDIDSENIFFLGHSRGSPAAVHCALDNPLAARAIAIMAPSMKPSEFSSNPVFRNTPFLIVTGGEDEHYRLNGLAMRDFIAAQSGVEVRYMEVPGEDHFFTQGTDQHWLFRQIFDFFSAHRSPQMNSKSPN